MLRARCRSAVCLLPWLLGFSGTGCQPVARPPSSRPNVATQRSVSVEESLDKNEIRKEIHGEKRTPLLTLKGSSKLVFAGNAPVLASVDEGIIRVWDLPGGKEREEIDLDDREATAIDLSPDGKTVAAVVTRDIPRRESRWSRNDRFLESPRTRIRLYDATTGRERLPGLKGQSESADVLAFSPDGKTLAAGSYGKVALWDLATRKERATLSTTVQESPSYLTYSPDGKILAARYPYHSGITLWDTATGRALPSPALDQETQFLGFSRSDQRLLMVRRAQKGARVLEEWEAATGQKQAKGKLELGPEMKAEQLALSPDGKWVVLGRMENGLFALCEAKRGKVRTVVQADQGSAVVAGFSSDGQLFATAPERGERTIKVWRVADLTQ